MTESVPAPVLVVDDRPDNLLAVEAVLEPLGLRLIKASSGKEALRHLLTEDVAVILLDVQMPELDGYETASLIKARTRTQNIPIIFLTARDRAVEHELAAYGSGGVDYLSKPFEPEVLRTKVKVFVDLYRQSKTIEAQRGELERRLEERDRAEASLRIQAAELERSNTELERFAFVASHDLREPLQVVAGFLDLLCAQQDEAGLGRELIDQALTSIDGMTRLVDDLLAYSRASSGQRRSDLLDLESVFAEVRAELAPSIEVGDVLITHDPLPEVVGDRWQIGRLLWNLLDNAITFRREVEAAVHVGLTRRNDFWVVSVRDNGVGIDPSDATRLFTILGRAHPRDPTTGTGVGLALCRRVVERHGGEIWMDGSPGRGCTVSFTIPVHEGEAVG